jgi:hypothetical protein
VNDEQRRYLQETSDTYDESPNSASRLCLLFRSSLSDYLILQNRIQNPKVSAGLALFLLLRFEAGPDSNWNTSAVYRDRRYRSSTEMSDFILTLDSDEEDYAPGPSSKRKQTKKTNGSQKVNGDADATAEEIALDDGFEFDVGGGVTMNGRNLQDGVDFWGAEADEVKGGQGVSTSRLIARYRILSSSPSLSRLMSMILSLDVLANRSSAAKTASERGKKMWKEAMKKTRTPWRNPKKRTTRR